MSSGEKAVSRRATHAGSWYTSDSDELNSQLTNWLRRAGKAVHGPAKAIIAPHAGYQYCGACAAHAYKEIDPKSVNTIFILGPSHHVRLTGCALSPATTYRTPLYDLTIDRDIYSELYKTRAFEEMSLHTDEEEHSIEMHLPYVAKVMENHRDFKVVPIMVGSLSADKEAMYGKLLSKYLTDPNTVFIVSSDFCHWGSRFHYQFYDKNWGEIYESITHLDRLGMDIIEDLDHSKFTSYLKQYGNTVCGRHPIGVLLGAVTHLNQSESSPNMKMRFLDYAQSSRCNYMHDSSVSYASSSLVLM